MGASDHSRKRKDIEARLKAEGWRIARMGPGDQVQYKHPFRKGRVTVDTGTKDIPTGTLKSIFQQAGWKW